MATATGMQKNINLFYFFIDKIKNFWFYLLFFIILFAGNQAQATVLENFDSYPVNTRIYSKAGWTLSNHDILVSATYSYTAPNSLRTNTADLYYWSPATTTNWTDLTFAFYWKNGVPTNWYGDKIIAPTGHLDGANYYLTVLYYDGYKIFLDQYGTTTDITVFTGVITTNIWHTIQLHYDNISDTITAIYDGGSVSAPAKTPDVLNVMNGFYTNAYLYLDNFLITEWTPPETPDYINFISPVNTIYSIYNFSWSLAYALSQSTITNYPDSYVGLAVEYQNIDTGKISYATSTGIAKILDNKFSTLSYTVQYSYTWPYNILMTPDQLGHYIATATLFRYDFGGTPLTIATTSWQMATGTPDETIWCSELCWDLDLTTATTTAVWGIPIPWLIPNFLNDGLCGIRYAGCYLLSPHQITKDLFNTSYNDFKQAFPFSVFFDITSTIKNVFSTSSVSTSGNFGLPMIRKVGTTTQYYIIPLLTSTTTAATIGESNAAIFRTSLTYLIYAAYTIGIILIIW